MTPGMLHQHQGETCLTHKDIRVDDPPKPIVWYERTVVRGDGTLTKFDRDRSGMRLDAQGHPRDPVSG